MEGSTGKVMASGFFLLSSAAVGNRMTMSPFIQAEMNSETKRRTSSLSNSVEGAEGVGSCLVLRILTLMTLLVSRFSFAFFSVGITPDVTCLSSASLHV
jgi:hypothetical protein